MACGEALGGPFLGEMWAKALRCGLGYDVHGHDLYDTCGRPIGRCLVRYGRKLWLRSARRPFATLFNVAWLTEATEEKRARGVAALMRREKLYSIELREAPGTSTGGTHLQLVTNYRQDLTATDRWERYSAIVRRAVRNAQRRGLVVTKTENAGLLFALLSSQEERRGRRTLPFGVEDFQKFYGIMADAGQAEIFVVKGRDGGACVGHLCLLEGRCAYDIVAARDMQRSGPTDNYLAVHYMLDYYQQAGFLVFDHCGASIPGVAEFKRRFSPMKVAMRRRTMGILGLLRLRK